MSGRETSNDQCVVQCSWIDACTGRRCVLHQGHAATGVQGGHDVYGLDTSDLTPEQEIDRLVAARTGPGRPMVQRPNEAPTRPSCASCAGPARAPRVDYPTVTELLDVLRRIAKYSTDPLVAADAATAVRQVESRSDSAKGGGE